MASAGGDERKPHPWRLLRTQRCPGSELAPGDKNGVLPVMLGLGFVVVVVVRQRIAQATPPVYTNTFVSQATLSVYTSTFLSSFFKSLGFKCISSVP